MKVFVKRLVTQEFLTDSGTWTPNSEQARDFKTSTDATNFCAVHAIGDSELVVQLPQNELGLLPYTPSYCYQDQVLSDF